MKGRFLSNLARNGKRHSYWFWAGVAALPFLVLALFAVLFPQQVWNDFLYRYFWGPVVSDAQDSIVNGVSEGYNVVSTIMYGVLLAFAFLIGYKLAKRLRLKIDLWFILACVPIFVFGGISRSLEDMELYRPWVQYLFISPLIYVQIGALFVIAMAIALTIERRERGFGYRAHLATFVGLIAGMLAVYFGVVLLGQDSLTSLVPWWTVLLSGLAAIILFHYLVRMKDKQLVNSALLSIGLLLTLVAIAYVFLFQTDNTWRSVFVLRTGQTIAPEPSELLIILGIAAVCTFAVFLLGRSLKATRWVLVAAPINLLMFFAHFLDGAATYRGMSLYGYTEKHVLPTAVIQAVGTPAIMLPFKFLLVLALILVLDILFDEDLKRYPNLANIVKFGVVFLGLAPGVRDMIRITMGV
ncbi:MAG TPA: DUF63 family protein [Methanomassiliicoccales archaeon]|nr:DUF63 family protein [Methanomassiliicoccales archaeon]